MARIAQIHVTVADVDRAVAFYRDTLGLRFLFQVPNRSGAKVSEGEGRGVGGGEVGGGVGANMAFFDCAGIRLMLGVAERESDHYASILYYHVPNIHTAHETLVARGVTFAGPPHKIADLGDHELWMAFFRDADANVLAISSEVAKQ
ncbi:MAG: VOC family protein [Gemmatimonadetes bacterium]|nr:VOC family protein [Gemmatimonadota bacterium]